MSEKVRVGVIGLGMGRHHLAGYDLCKDKAEIVALCDIDEDRLSEFKEKYNVPKAFKDYREMLALKDLDVVSVATPNYLHASITIDALKAGKHVLCEKPMAMNAEEAQGMVDEAKKAKKKLMIHFNFRFSPQSQLLKRYIEAGELGRIYYAKTGWHRRRGFPRLGSWFLDKSKSGGGPLIDLAVHRLDLALWLMGHPEPLTVSGSIYTEIGNKIAEAKGKSFGVEDLASAFIRLKGGATLFVEVSWASNTERKEDIFTALFGTEGGAEQRNAEEGYGFTLKIFKEKYGGTVALEPEDYPKEFVINPQEHFIDCILNDEEPMPSGEQGLRISKILDAIYESAQKGEEVKIK